MRLLAATSILSVRKGAKGKYWYKLFRTSKVYTKYREVTFRARKLVFVRNSRFFPCSRQHFVQQHSSSRHLLDKIIKLTLNNNRIVI